MAQQKKRDNQEPVFRMGLWKRVGKHCGPYLGGSNQKYFVNYFRNDDPERKEGDKDGNLKLQDRGNPDEQPILVNMYKRISGASGKKYITGIRGFRFNIFANENKKTPQSPDFNLVVWSLEDAAPLVDEVAQKPEMPYNEIEDPGFLSDPQSETPEQEGREIDGPVGDGFDSDDIPF